MRPRQPDHRPRTPSSAETPRLDATRTRRPPQHHQGPSPSAPWNTEPSRSRPADSQLSTTPSRKPSSRTAKIDAPDTAGRLTGLSSRRPTGASTVTLRGVATILLANVDLFMRGKLDALLPSHQLITATGGSAGGQARRDECGLALDGLVGSRAAPVPDNGRLVPPDRAVQGCAATPLVEPNRPGLSVCENASERRLPSPFRRPAGTPRSTVRSWAYPAWRRPFGGLGAGRFDRFADSGLHSLVDDPLEHQVGVGGRRPPVDGG